MYTWSLLPCLMFDTILLIIILNKFVHKVMLEMTQARQISYIPLTVKLHLLQPDTQLRSFHARQHAYCYIHNGTGYAQIDQEGFKLESGLCLLIRPEMTVTLNASGDQYLQLFYVTYTGKNHHPDGDTPIPAMIDCESPAIQLASPAQVHTLLQSLTQLADDQTSHGLLKRTTLFHQWALLVSESIRPPSVSDAIQETIRYMERHYTQPLPLHRLPLLARMTSSSYCRAFRRSTGLTPGQYLTQLRVERSKQLLRLPHTTLKDIAASVGYQDELYFSRVFKKSEGLSPTVYAKKSQPRVAVVSGLCLQDHLLALGCSPVAASSFPSYYATPSGFPSYLHPHLKDTRPLNAEQQIAAQDVLRLSPDLIIKMEFARNPNAPAWAATGNTLFLNGYADWTDYQRALAAQVGREDKAEQLIEQSAILEETVSDQLASRAQTGTWAIVRLLPGDCRVYGASGHALPDLFYTKLRFQPAEHLQHSFYKKHALELLATVDPDHILIVWSDPDAVKEMGTHPLWCELRAVREGRVHCPNTREWDPWGPLGRGLMMQDMVRYFQAM